MSGGKTMPQPKSDLDHFLQLRLSKQTVAEIDRAITTIPEFGSFSRCRFIRSAVNYALSSLGETQDEHKQC